MSQWTHVLGVVRYDSANLDVYPPPKDRDGKVALELAIVEKIFKVNRPYGTEGPLRLDFLITDRGPTIIITGDLGAFGKKDLNSIVDWLNLANKEVRDFFQIKADTALDELACTLFSLRDGFLNCEVEFDESVYNIVYDNTPPDSDEWCFKLLTFNRY